MTESAFLTTESLTHSVEIVEKLLDVRVDSTSCLTRMHAPGILRAALVRFVYSCYRCRGFYAIVACLARVCESKPADTRQHASPGLSECERRNRKKRMNAGLILAAWKDLGTSDLQIVEFWV